MMMSGVVNKRLCAVIKLQLTDPENLHGIQGVSKPEAGTQENERQAGGTGAQLKRQEILDVVEDALALLDGVQDGGEVVVGQYHV